MEVPNGFNRQVERVDNDITLGALDLLASVEGLYSSAFRTEQNLGIGHINEGDLLNFIWDFLNLCANILARKNSNIPEHTPIEVYQIRLPRPWQTKRPNVQRL
jgi:hypothetical protein